MKKLTALILTAALMVTSAGCTTQNAQLGTIGLDAAKTAALEELGIDPSKAVLEGIEVKTYDGKEYYEIDFKVDGRDYECNIDALTGAIISIETPDGVKIAEKAEDKQTETKNDAEKATENTAENKTEKTNTDTGTAKASESTKSATAQTATATQKSEAAQKSAATELIGEEKAKQIALGDAGVAAKDATFVKVNLDRDDGKVEYEVEFYSGNVEYDYDIDAYSGKITSVDRDIENYTIKKETAAKAENTSAQQNTAQSNATNAIGEAAAKKLALAQVPGALESDIREFETDRDDGRVEYEGKIVYGGVEYEFEIDGHSGAFRKWEAETIAKPAAAEKSASSTESEKTTVKVDYDDDRDDRDDRDDDRDDRDDDRDDRDDDRDDRDDDRDDRDDD